MFQKELYEIYERDLTLSKEQYFDINHKNNLISCDELGNETSHDKPTIYLHIGTTKTGSTQIQKILDNNKSRFWNNGIWYPEIGHTLTNRKGKLAGHSGLLKYAIDNDPHIEKYFLNAINYQKGSLKKIILSSEAYFLTKHVTQIVSYFKEYQLKLVVYFRRQDLWADSHYRENLMGGARSYTTLDFDSWLNTKKTQRLINYYRFIKNWEKILSPSNIIIRLYDKKYLKDGDIWSDFCQAIDIREPSNLILDHERANDLKLPARFVSTFIEYNNKEYTNKEQYLEFVNKLYERLIPTINPKNEVYTLLSPSISNNIMETHRIGNAKLKSEYFTTIEDNLFSTDTIQYSELKNSISEEESKIFYSTYKDIVVGN